MLVHPLPGFLVKEFNLWPVNSVQRDARLARLDLRLERFAELLQRGFLQVHGFRQAQVVKFLQMMPQRGIHFGFACRWVENVIVSDALLPGQFDRQEQQRRMNALVRCLFEIIPAQETQHESKLYEAILRSITTGFADDLVQHAREPLAHLAEQRPRHPDQFHRADRRHRLGSPPGVGPRREQAVLFQPVGQQRHLAEVVVGAEAGEHLLPPGDQTEHLERPRPDHVERVRHVALGEHQLTGRRPQELQPPARCLEAP